MSVEPGIVDTNVLVYALDADAPQHAAARALLETAREASITLFTTSQILCEFYSIVTNPRRVSKPRSAADALAAISNLLAFLHVLPVPAHTVDGWMDLLRPIQITAGPLHRNSDIPEGRTGRATSLGGDTPAITARSLRHATPPQMAKVELRSSYHDPLSTRR